MKKTMEKLWAQLFLRLFLNILFLQNITPLDCSVGPRCHLFVLLYIVSARSNSDLKENFIFSLSLLCFNFSISSPLLMECLLQNVITGNSEISKLSPKRCGVSWGLRVGVCAPTGFYLSGFLLLVFVIPQGSVLCFCFNTNVIHITFRCFLKDLRQSGAVGTIYRSLMNYFKKIFFETQLGWLPPWISMWEHVGEDKFHQREVLTHFQV